MQTLASQLSFEQRFRPVYIKVLFFVQIHRVVVPHEELRRLTARQSMAFFVHPDNDVIIECLDGSGHYPPITSLEYLNQRLVATYL
jgi:hypothetical protein